MAWVRAVWRLRRNPGELRARRDDVSMPSVRAVWRAPQTRGDCKGSFAFQCPRCGRCGSRGVTATTSREGLTFQCPRCGRCGSRGDGDRSGPRSRIVSMPSVRAVWLARSGSLRFGLLAPCFNALGAGDVAQSDVYDLSADSLDTGFSTLGAGDVPGHAATCSALSRRGSHQCPRCGRCGSRGGPA